MGDNLRQSVCHGQLAVKQVENDSIYWLVNRSRYRLSKKARSLLIQPTPAVYFFAFRASATRHKYQAPIER